MIVECPACHTRYRIENAGGIDDSTFFECSQEECRHVFPYSPPLLGGGNAAGPSLDPPPPASLSQKSAALQAEQDQALVGTSASSRPARTAESLAVAPLDELPDFSPLQTPFLTEEGEDDDGRVILPQPPSLAHAGEDDDGWVVLSQSTAEPEPEVTFPLRPFLLLLGLLVLGYAALGFYCLSHPAATEAVLARLPLLGSLFTTERVSAQHIALTELTGNYWLTKDNRRVFAVSGKATNNATVPARSIQVEGAIYDANGKVVGQRVIFCGTETAAAVLASLTVREIGILQNLVPPKQFSVPAGQTVNFLLVFTTPPPSIAEFSCRVVAAQFGPPD